MNPTISVVEPYSPKSPDELRQAFQRLRLESQRLAKQPLSRLLEVLDRLRERWQKGTDYYHQAIQLLSGTFSPRAIEAALESLWLGMSPPIVLAGLQRELGRTDLLDKWEPDLMGIGHVRGYPLGVVAQILAGNVFLGGVIALSQSLLTRNAVLLKLSREDSGFTALFVKALNEVDQEKVISPSVLVCSWNSREEPLNEVVRTEADGIVVWGGTAAIAGYPTDGCRGRVIHYGPRLGIGLVLSDTNLSHSMPALAWDVALWEQQACSSPRIVMVEDADGSMQFPRSVATLLQKSLHEIRTKIPPRPLSLDEKAEVRSIRELAWWTDQAELFAPEEAADHTVLLVRHAPPNVPMGYRTVVLVAVPSLDKISKLLSPFRSWLQTAVLASPAHRWKDAVGYLIEAGITEVAAVGSAAARFLGLPHEGEFALRRLVRLVGIDLGAGPLTFPDRSAETTKTISEALR
jgi:hypothetical protein